MPCFPSEQPLLLVRPPVILCYGTSRPMLAATTTVRWPLQPADVFDGWANLREGQNARHDLICEMLSGSRKYGGASTPQPSCRLTRRVKRFPKSKRSSSDRQSLQGWHGTPLYWLLVSMSRGTRCLHGAI